MDNWEARVVFEPGRLANAVYLIRVSPYGVRKYLVGKDKVISVEKGKATTEDLVFAYLDSDQLNALMSAFDAFGVKKPDAGFTEGKLEATEKHLEDMRTMLSLNLPKLMPPKDMRKFK